ncbi:MAG: nucleotidyltransferase domain-containing protein [Candidatus Firestonebacteria bacterium]
MPMDNKDVKDKLKKYINNVKLFLDLKMVVLYGSHAKGLAKENSDIDVAVFVSKKGKMDYLEKGKLLFRLRREIDSRIEPNLFYMEEVRHREKADFISEILKTGKVIYKGR